MGAKFLRIGEWEVFSHSSEKPPPVSMLHNGKLMTPEEMPIQQSLWFGKHTRNQEIEYKHDKVYFDLMIEELDRANEIITEYLGMAKDKIVNLQPQYLDQVVKDIYPLIEADANYKGMNIKLDLNKPPMPIIDKNEIRQMVLNMAQNGMEAMPAGGTLTIGTTVAARETVLYIKDEGHGLSAEILDKLGTPFITTKEKGTGLGLAVCYSIAARHNARIDFKTSTKGTTFYVYFPLPKEDILLF
jgi:signal transduction histidine kinase